MVQQPPLIMIDPPDTCGHPQDGVQIYPHPNLLHTQKRKTKYWFHPYSIFTTYMKYESVHCTAVAYYMLNLSHFLFLIQILEYSNLGYILWDMNLFSEKI